MSFTTDVKEEIIRNQINDICKKARLSALLQLLASLSISNNGLILTLKHSSASLIKIISMDVLSLYGVKTELLVFKQQAFEKRNIYTAQIKDKAKEILNDLDLWTDRGLQEHPRLSFLKNDEMMKAYLTGCFLATGSVNSPKTTSYHLEIRANSLEHANFLIKLLEKFYVTAKVTSRREQEIVYIKKGEQIADILRIMNANEAIMNFEDIRIQRDFVNNMRRLDNIEIANNQKSQIVADRQVEAVEFLKQRDLLKYLSPKDREIALLRYNNPDASLSELSEIYKQETGDRLTKSGIRHRFDKVYALLEQYKKGE